MRKPNAFQKLLHRLGTVRSITGFFAPRLHRIDMTILRLTQGKYSASEILGWPIVLLTTTGARTKQPRTMPLIGILDGDKIALIASSFGRERRPGWYYNLKAQPLCKVQIGSRSGMYLARQTEGRERDRYWRLALSYYAGYEKYQEWAGRRVPIMVLEPKR